MSVLGAIPTGLNARLFTAAMVIYLLAFAMAAGVKALRGDALARFNSAQRRWQWALVACAVLYAAIAIFLSIQRYNKLLCGLWDMGILESLFHNALHGRLFQDFRGPYDHFQPLYLLLVPLYAVWPDGRMLLVIQAAAYAAAAWPLYLLAKETSRSAVLAALAGILYLLCPLTGEANLYDFYTVCLSPVCFFAMLLFMVRKRWRWYWVFAVLTLSVTESEAILVLGGGLYLISRGELRRGLITAGLAVVWFFAATLVALPLITGQEFRHLNRYLGIEDSLYTGILSGGVAARSANYFARLASVGAFILVPLSFLPARRWRALALVFLPAFAVLAVSTNVYQRVIFGHYAATMAAAALGALALALEGVQTSDKRGAPSVVPLFVLLAAVFSNILFSFPANERGVFQKARLDLSRSWNVIGLPVPFNAERRAFYATTDHERLLFAIRGAFPEGSKVTAQENLGYLFVNRCTVYRLRDDISSDFYLFDLRVNPYRVRDDTYEAHFRMLDADPGCRRFYDSRGEGGRGYVFYGRGEAWVPVAEKIREFERSIGE